MTQSTKLNAQNSKCLKEGTGEATSMLHPKGSPETDPFFLSCSLMIDVIWNFCLAIQGHVLCHDCSDFGIHVLLQNHQQKYHQIYYLYPIKHTKVNYS